jgi:hypothetical protein
MLYEETTLPCQNVSCMTFSSRFIDNPTLYLKHIEMPDAVFWRDFQKRRRMYFCFYL